MTNLKLLLVAVIPAGVFIALVFASISIINRLNMLLVKVDEGRSGIDIALEKRYDLINEQVAVVKRYLQHEYDVLVDVTKSRNGMDTLQEAEKLLDGDEARQAEERLLFKQQLENCYGYSKKAALIRDRKNQLKTVKAIAQEKLNNLKEFEQTLNGIGKNMRVLTEQYPNLISATPVQQLQLNIQETEEYLQAARRLYNSNVSIYNQSISKFPVSVIARLRNLGKAPFYEGSEEKKNVSVQL